MIGTRKRVLSVFIVSLCTFQLLLLYHVMTQISGTSSSFNKLTATVAETSTVAELSRKRFLEKLVHNTGGEIASIKEIPKITDGSSMKRKTLDKVLSAHTNKSEVQSFTILPKIEKSSWNRTCLDNWCVSYLQKNSFLCYKRCRSHVKIGKLLAATPRRCKFRKAARHHVVALVSVPGSGNTWVRGVLEKATGICTGSIYCDIPLRNKGFVGEYVHDGSVLVVKTHTSDFQWKRARLEKRSDMDAFYDAAILLIRSPFDTFVAERHRSILLKQKKIVSHVIKVPGNEHLDRVGEEAFNASSWNVFVKNITVRWKKTVIKWLTSGHSVLVVRYEDLLVDILHQVERILTFLKVPYNKAELVEKLAGGFDDFRRNHTPHSNHLHYSSLQRKNVNRMITETVQELKLNRLGSFGIEEYVHE